MNAPTQTCPDLGRWRAWLDRPQGGSLQGGNTGAAPDWLSAHLDGCAVCAGLVSDLRQNAALASTLIGGLRSDAAPSPAAIELARARLTVERARRHGTMAHARPAPNQPHPIALAFRRWRPAVAAIAAVLLLAAVAGTPWGRDAAAQFLAQFRAERFEPVPLTTVQLQDLETTFAELEQLGTVEGVDALSGGPPTVASVAEAERITGLSVKLPEPAALPAAYRGASPSVNAVPAGQIRFTFDQAKARAYYASTGRANVRLPDRFDGATLVLNTPAAVVLGYARASGGGGIFPTIPLFVGEAGTLTIEVEGNVSLEEMREFLLGLPGLSPETVRQLRAIDDWRTTLPIPIPVDAVDWERTTIAGGPGLLLADKSGLGSVAIWQRDGRIFGVGGAISGKEVKRVADALR